jgi:hypothetical protein
MQTGICDKGATLNEALGGVNFAQKNFSKNLRGPRFVAEVHDGLECTIGSFMVRQ